MPEWAVRLQSRDLNKIVSLGENPYLKDFETVPVS